MIYKTCSKCRHKYEYGKKCPCVIKHNKLMNVIQEKDDNFYTSKAWRIIRKLILERDHYCQRCYHKYDLIITSSLEVHHIVARSVNKLLELEPTNLVTVCKTCNLQLGTNGVDWEHVLKGLQEYAL